MSEKLSQTHWKTRLDEKLRNEPSPKEQLIARLAVANFAILGILITCGWKYALASVVGVLLGYLIMSAVNHYESGVRS